MDSGQRTVDGGQRTVDGGQRTVDGFMFHYSLFIITIYYLPVLFFGLGGGPKSP